MGLEGKSIRESIIKRKKEALKEEKEYQFETLKLINFLKRIKNLFTRIKKKYILTKQENRALKIGQFRLGGEIHQWMYDRYSLSELLKEIGFTDVKICNAFESGIKNWQTYELDVIDGVVRKPDSLFIEAKK